MRTKHLIRDLKKLGFTKTHIVTTIRLSRKMKLTNRRAFAYAKELNDLMRLVIVQKLNVVPAINLEMFTGATKAFANAINGMIKSCMSLLNAFMRNLDPGELAFLYSTGND